MLNINNIAKELPSYMINEDLNRIKNINHKPIIKLCSNESPLGTNPIISNQILNKLNEIHLYPDPEANELKKLIANKNNINTNQIVIGNGSTEIIDLITQDAISNGDSAIISDYSYPLYEILIKNNHGKPVIVPTMGWQYDLKKIHDAIQKNTKIIFLANPNNPTGTWISYNDLNNFLKKIPENILVIIDEAYYDFLENEPGYKSSIVLVNNYKNVIVTRTFSKVYGLAGLRVGYAISSSETIARIKKRKQSANVNIIAQYAATIAYNDEYYRKNVVKEVKINRNFLQKELKKHKINYISTKTNFILIEVSQSSLDIYRKLLNFNIIVQPMEFYNLKNYIRVSIGTKHELKIFVNSLLQVIK